MVIESKNLEICAKYTCPTVTISVLVLVTSSAGILIKDTYAKESTSWTSSN
jgi:hypothetical protein